MTYTKIVMISILIMLCSGTALASVGGEQSPSSSLPALGASSAGPQTTLGAQFTQQGPSQQAPMAVYSQQPPSQAGGLHSFDVSGASQSSVYYQGSYQPFGQFYPGNSPLFWIDSSVGWSWYASIPMGYWARELMYIPYAGPINVYEVYPSGITQLYSLGYVSSGYNYIWFYGDVSGRHTTFFTVNDNPSNAVMIDVTYGYQGGISYPYNQLQPYNTIGSSSGYSSSATGYSSDTGTSTVSVGSSSTGSSSTGGYY